MHKFLLIALFFAIPIFASYDEGIEWDYATLQLDFGGEYYSQSFLTSVKFGPTLNYYNDDLNIDMLISPLVGYRYQYSLKKELSTNLFMPGVCLGTENYDYSKDFSYQLNANFLVGKSNNETVTGYRAGAKILFIYRIFSLEAAYIELNHQKGVELLIGIDFFSIL